MSILVAYVQIPRHQTDSTHVFKHGTFGEFNQTDTAKDLQQYKIHKLLSAIEVTNRHPCNKSGGGGVWGGGGVRVKGEQWTQSYVQLWAMLRTLKTYFVVTLYMLRFPSELLSTGDRH